MFNIFPIIKLLFNGGNSIQNDNISENTIDFNSKISVTFQCNFSYYKSYY